MTKDNIDNKNNPKEEIENDIKEEGDLRYGIYNQKQPIAEGQIAWRIDGMYKDDDFNMKSRLSLLKEAPTLVIENDKGQKANFVLTKKLTNDLTKSLTALDYKYKGISNKKKIKVKDIKNIITDWREWPLEALALMICTIVLIISMFIR